MCFDVCCVFQCDCRCTFICLHFFAQTSEQDSTIQRSLGAATRYVVSYWLQVCSFATCFVSWATFASFTRSARIVLRSALILVVTVGCVALTARNDVDFFDRKLTGAHSVAGAVLERRFGVGGLLAYIMSFNVNWLFCFILLSALSLKFLLVLLNLTLFLYIRLGKWSGTFIFTCCGGGLLYSSFRGLVPYRIRDLGLATQSQAERAHFGFSVRLFIVLNRQQLVKNIPLFADDHQCTASVLPTVCSCTFLLVYLIASSTRSLLLSHFQAKRKLLQKTLN